MRCLARHNVHVSGESLASEALRAGSVLVFLLSITVTAHLLDKAGVFRAAAVILARIARGNGFALWLLSVCLATATTILLSLDTCAVLLTPVLLTVARRVQISPWPFALATVWLADAASLVLPVSNLTNLLLVQRLGWSIHDFTGRMIIPALTAIIVTIVMLFLLFGRQLRHDRYSTAATHAPGSADIPLLRISALICLLLAVLLVFNVAAWIAATSCALLLVILFLIRQPSALSLSMIPVKVLAFTIVLFLGIGLLQAADGLTWTDHIVGSGEDFWSLLRLSTVAAVTSNAINNLPAYLALEPSAGDSSVRLLALLVGANVGPLITMWGSLATMLWRERCAAAGLHVSAKRFALLGFILVPTLLITTTGALWLTN